LLLFLHTESIKGYLEIEKAGPVWPCLDYPNISKIKYKKQLYSTFLRFMPHLHLPGDSESVLQAQEPPQLQKYIPVPSMLTRLTGLPHMHLLGSLGSRPAQLQPSAHWQRIASFPSTLRTCPHFIGFPQAQLPGCVLIELQSHCGPQSQV
jgi:hypothetical protein